MDIINHNSLQFCTFCLHAKLPTVDLYIIGSSTELQESLRALLGDELRLESVAICEPCWKIAQLFQDFRLRCEKANMLVQRIGKGLGSEDDWFSQRNLTAIEGIRMVIKEQLQEIERVAENASEEAISIKSEFFEVKTEPIDEDSSMVDEWTGAFSDAETSWKINQDEIKETAEESLETALEINAIKIDPDVDHTNNESPKAVKNRSHEHIRKGIRIDPMYMSAECPDVFKSHKRLATHAYQQSEHRPFKCRNNCERAYTSSKNRRKHELRCGKETYQCNLCGVQMDRRRSLYDHYNHVHPGEPKHPCSYCEKRFKKKEQLQRHEKRIHSGERERDFSCQQCGQMFFESNSLNRHVKTQH